MEVAVLNSVPVNIISRGCDDGENFSSKEDYSGISVEDSDHLELEQNEPILYSGPVFKEDENEYLIEPDMGFVKGNIKKRVNGFDLEEKRICPLVDRKSAILYDIVQQLEEEQLISTLAALRSYKKPVVIPREILEEEEGSYIALKIVDPEEWKKREEERIIDAELDEQRKLLGETSFVNDTYRVPFSHGWTREVVVRIHPTPPKAELGEYQLTSIGEVFYRDPAGNKIRSMKQIAILLDKDPVPGLSIKNFTFGKAPIGIKDQTKEIIRKIISGKQTVLGTPNKGLTPVANKTTKRSSGSEVPCRPAAGSVSPTGPKLKSSSSRRSIQPPKRYATSQTFAYPEKRSKTGMKKDVEYPSDNEMEMGMLPPKYPRGREDYGGNVADDSFIRRRGRPASKKSDIKETPDSEYNGESDSTLFQISAFHNHSQSSLFEAIDDESQSDDAVYSGMPVINTNNENHSEETTAAGEGHGSEELLPCSIRCPGMTGEIPTLQCKRCLCLYHPECLALPPNLNFRNFLCANCEGEHAEGLPAQNTTSSNRHGHKSAASSSGTSNATAPDASKTSGSWMPKLEKSLKVKKPPPPLLPAFQKFGGKFPRFNSKLNKIIPPRMNIMPPPSVGRSFPSGNSSNRINAGNKMSSPVSLIRPSDDSMSISPITMKRGRGRPPKSPKLFPNLSNRNLTITPISIRPRLPVPNLAPMSKSSKPLALGIFPPPKMKVGSVRVQQRHAPAVNKGRGLMTSMCASSGPGRLSDNIFREIKDVGRGVKPLQPPMSIINKGPGGFPLFKRYVQSVVSIGTKKFIAVPREGSEIVPPIALTNKVLQRGVVKKLLHQAGTNNEATANAKKTLLVPSEIPTSAANIEDTKKVDEIQVVTTSTAYFDSDQEIIRQIFEYLNVKDLLRASRVCRLWSEVATDESLWKVVRMKNHRISDIDAFIQFLRLHNAEQLDLRKMIISAEEIDWETLFESLSEVPTLHRITVGPRTVPADRVSTLRELCPNVEICTS